MSISISVLEFVAFLCGNINFFSLFYSSCHGHNFLDLSESALWAKSVNAREKFDRGSPAQAYWSSVPEQNESLSEEKIKLLIGNIHISTVISSISPKIPKCLLLKSFTVYLYWMSLHKHRYKLHCGSFSLSLTWKLTCLVHLTQDSQQKQKKYQIEVLFFFSSQYLSYSPLAMVKLNMHFKKQHKLFLIAELRFKAVHSKYKIILATQHVLTCVDVFPRDPVSQSHVDEIKVSFLSR